MELKDIQTKEQYEEYKRRVDEFFKREKLNSLTSIDPEAEEYFSWKECDCCNRSLGGNRIDCHGYSSIDKEIKGPYSICTDCYYFAEYDQLDDMTMLEIEK